MVGPNDSSKKPQRSKGRDNRRGKFPDEERNEELSLNAETQFEPSSSPSDDQDGAAFSATNTRTTSSIVVGLSARELRQQRREKLRSKATGLGLSISTSNQSSAQKIVFDDDVASIEQITDSKLTREMAPLKTSNAGDENEDDGEDDDNAIEEVKTSVARQEDQKQRHLERTSVQSRVTKKKSRKRGHREKHVDANGSDEEAELDEAFFAQLEAERQEERREKRRKLELLQPIGQKTTFVVEGDEAILAPNIIKPMEHNIQVVVLAPATITASNGIANVPASLGQPFEPIARSTLHYSRNLLVDGCDVMSARQQHRAKKSGKKDTTTLTGWKRSKKMNRLLTVPGVMSSKKRQKAGAAAPHFVVRP